MTLAQAAKFATIMGIILTAVVAGFSGLAWATTQAVDYGTVKATVDAHTKMLEKIDAKLDQIRTEIITTPFVGKVSP